MTEHTHDQDHDDDSACAVAHGAVAPASQVTQPRPATSATGPGPASRAAGERTLVAVFASPVAGYLLRYGTDAGFRGLLLEPDEARAAGAAALGLPLLAAVPDDLDGSVDLVVTDEGVDITATTRTADRTGVEMEALTSVSVAGLALIDMVKAIDPAAVITDVRVEWKEGGKTGRWARP